MELFENSSENFLLTLKSGSEIYCRLCMSTSKNQRKYVTIDTHIQKLLMELLNIFVDCDDLSYSTSICKKCLQTITNFVKFREICLKNQDKLQVFSTVLAISEEQNENSLENKLIEEIFIPSETINVKTEDVLVDQEEKKQKSKRKPKSSRSNLKEPAMRKEKGKETYQKLLTACEFCGKLIERNRMDGHRNQHLGVRPYECEDCKKLFFCKNLLRLHKSTIHTGKQISCPECNRVFPSKRSLYAHSLIHQNKDKFVCDLCSRKFSSRNALKRHLVSHTGIREFQCPYCDMAFYRKYNLLVHIRCHTKERKYNCPVCQQPYAYRRLMKEHVMKMHPEYDKNLLNITSSNYSAQAKRKVGETEKLPDESG